MKEGWMVGTSLMKKGLGMLEPPLRRKGLGMMEHLQVPLQNGKHLLRMFMKKERNLLELSKTFRIFAPKIRE